MTEFFTHAGLAVSAFLSSTLLPGSSEATLLALAMHRPDNAMSLWAVATIANTAGAIVNWWLGFGLLHLADRNWFPVTRRQIDDAASMFGRFGKWSLLLSWMPVVGDPLTLAAGVLRVPFPVFLVLVGTGKAARYAALLGGLAYLS